MRPRFRVPPIRGRSVAVGVLMAAAIAMPAAAASPSTMSSTQTFHGVQSGPLTNPCNGDTIDATGTANIMVHETYFTTSDEAWFAVVIEATFTGADQGTGETFTGRTTQWFNGNLNRQNSNFTGTITMKATGSYGTVISAHEVAHATLLPGGSIAISFDKLTGTCG